MKKLIYVLACLSIFMSTAIGYSQNLLENIQKTLVDNTQKRQEELKKNSIELRQSIVLGGIRFTLMKVLSVDIKHLLKNPAWQNKGGTLPQRPAYLILHYLIENITETQVIKVPNFGGLFNFQYIALEDNFGNELEIFGEHLPVTQKSTLKTLASNEWQSKKEELLPKEFAKKIIVANAPKVEKATSFNLKLEVFVDNKKTAETVLVVFKKSDIKALLTKPSSVPVVTLYSPKNGSQGMAEGDAVMVMGTVDDKTVTQATLFLDGIPLSSMEVIDGVFKRKIFLPAGRTNTVRVMVINKYGVIGYSPLHTVFSGSE